MKKILLFLLLLAPSFFASAQAYLPTYNRTQQSQMNYSDPTYGTQQRRYNPPQSSTKSYRTTAYRIDYQGNAYKMPIVVDVTVSGYGSVSMKVTQKYVTTGLGGRWEKIYSGGIIQECQSLVNSNSLESQFMYKAIVDTNTWYFDL